MINGGYILQPRIFDESEASKLHPVARELWFYLIRKVNHKDNSKFKRGQGFFRYKDIQDGLSWAIGFRKETYSKTQIYKALRRLNESRMTTTTKTTRGIVITICNYEIYQNPKNYEDYNERTTKTTMGLHDKQECKEVIIKTMSDKPDDIQILFAYWQEIHNHKRAKLDLSRKKKIKARLKDGYSVEEIKMAIEGCKLSAHHMGKNENGTIYDDIELICRDSKHIDSFIKQKENSKTSEW